VYILNQAFFVTKCNRNSTMLVNAILAQSCHAPVCLCVCHKRTVYTVLKRPNGSNYFLHRDYLDYLPELIMFVLEERVGLKKKTFPKRLSIFLTELFPNSGLEKNFVIPPRPPSQVLSTVDRPTTVASF